MSINAGTGPCGDASTLRGNGVDVDPKEMFDDFTTTANAPAGRYPYGIDGTPDIFYPITDNTDAITLNTGPRVAPSTLPRTPLSGEMASRSSKPTVPRV